MTDVLQLWSDLGEDRLHLFVSWCTVQVAALYANQELIESYYDKSSRKARAHHGAFCLSRAMSLSGPKALFLNQYIRKLHQAGDDAYARTVTSSVREAFHNRLSSWTYYNPNVTVIPDWKYLTSAFRYFDTVSSDPTVAPPEPLPDMSTDSFVHNWHKVAQSVMGTAGLAAALLYSVTRHRYYLASPDAGDFELLPYALSFPLFQADLTDALNYGGLGAVVSQALGRILMKAYAAYPESEGPINAVLECLRQDPYSQSSSDDVGVVFGPEAFALGALVEAYRNVTAPDRSLAGMEEYSAMQLFFIALCYNKCEGMSTGSWEPLCNVPLRHLPAFAEAFQCKLYTPMNPFLRCNFI
ncbi:hypothetical protein HPB50_014077 [Hyalomma asiaticum]|uniref:Uncharacterized protein n=1 Tax=Hyalomma asiaticum TaxID=266040 RepID=A0ACB7S9X8_HYAAI|nr:hypothetical protein HPB50_014077 [Hyalomma asiaticum]